MTNPSSWYKQKRVNLNLHIIHRLNRCSSIVPRKLKHTTRLSLISTCDLFTFKKRRSFLTYLKPYFHMKKTLNIIYQLNQRFLIFLRCSSLVNIIKTVETLGSIHITWVGECVLKTQYILQPTNSYFISIL